MKINHLSTCKTLLLLFCIVNYSFAGTLPDPDQAQVIKKFGIDENGHYFEYTVPGAGIASSESNASPSRLTKAKIVKHYGIDENGRSFEYDEHPNPPLPVIASAPTKTKAVRIVKSVPLPPATSTAKILPESPPAQSLAKTVAPSSKTALAVTPAVPLKQASAASRPTVVAQKRPDATIKPTTTSLQSVGAKVEPAPADKTLQTTVHETAPKSSPGYRKGEFIVKVSAGDKPATTIPLRHELEKLGASVVQSRVEREAKQVYRLLYSRCQERSQANLAVAKLHALGQKAYIISDKNGNKVYCGSYFQEEKAKGGKKYIASKGIRLTITKDFIVVKNNYYLASGFTSREAALKLSGSLRQHGIRSTVLSTEQDYAQRSITSGIKG